MKYPILWVKIWKELSKIMNKSLSLTFVSLIIIRFFKSDMSVEATFEYITIAQLPFFFLGIFMISVVLSLLVALIYRLSGVEVKGGCLIAPNIWM
ncbi:hypothetical protein L8S13_24115, partial [Vibrio lentus]